jgi:hypothetical protein
MNSYFGAPSSRSPNRGELVWFNEAEDHGVLETEDGERITFHGNAFAGGERPVGRVGGVAVEFRMDETRLVPSEITVIVADAARRARRRRN